MDAGGKRCLPAWMLKKSAPEELRESGNGESQLSFPGQPHIQASLRKTKAADLGVEEAFARLEAKKLDENPGSLFCSEMQKRSRKSSRLDLNPKTTSCSKSGLERKKAPDRKSVDNRSTLRERSHSKKLKPTINVSRPENDVDTGALPLRKSEDDVGLTVEDLVGIAEEYMNADKEKQLWQNANEESKSEAHNSSSSVFTRNNSGALCEAARSSPEISSCTTTMSSSHSSATDMGESAHLNIARTGDAAQDMLDVFLGPLLKIPTEVIKPEKTRKEEITIASQFSMVHRNNPPRDEELTFVKKKSSLKDKVAIFLTDSEMTKASD